MTFQISGLTSAQCNLVRSLLGESLNAPTALILAKALYAKAMAAINNGDALADEGSAVTLDDVFNGVSNAPATYVELVGHKVFVNVGDETIAVRPFDLGLPYDNLSSLLDAIGDLERESKPFRNINGGVRNVLSSVVDDVLPNIVGIHVFVPQDGSDWRVTVWRDRSSFDLDAFNNLHGLLVPSNSPATSVKEAARGGKKREFSLLRFETEPLSTPDRESVEKALNGVAVSALPSDQRSPVLFTFSAAENPASDSKVPKKAAKSVATPRKAAKPVRKAAAPRKAAKPVRKAAAR